MTRAARLLKITPEVISVLDYRKGFGHTDLAKIWRVAPPRQSAVPPSRLLP